MDPEGESQEVTLKFGSKTEKLEKDSKFENSLYSYTFTDDGITQQTVLTPIREKTG